MPGNDEQDGRADGQAEFEADKHGRDIQDVTGKGIHFPESADPLGKQGTGQIVEVQHHNETHQIDHLTTVHSDVCAQRSTDAEFNSRVRSKKTNPILLSAGCIFVGVLIPGSISSLFY